jgi:hypothetical protein
LALTVALLEGLAGMRERRGGHDPGRVVRDLAVMVADGGDCVADLRAVRDQEPLLGRSIPTRPPSGSSRRSPPIRRLPGALREARARARRNAWTAGAWPARIAIDIDATPITAHSDKDPERMLTWVRAAIAEDSVLLRNGWRGWARTSLRRSRAGRRRG